MTDHPKPSIFDGLDGIDRCVAAPLVPDLVGNPTPLTPELLEECARLLLEAPPIPLCGSKKRPHLVAPGGKVGDRRRCVQCSEVVELVGGYRARSL
jgi:hypothetical protein